MLGGGGGAPLRPPPAASFVSPALLPQPKPSPSALPPPAGEPKHGLSVQGANNNLKKKGKKRLFALFSPLNPRLYSPTIPLPAPRGAPLRACRDISRPSRAGRASPPPHPSPFPSGSPLPVPRRRSQHPRRLRSGSRDKAAAGSGSPRAAWRRRSPGGASAAAQGHGGGGGEGKERGRGLWGAAAGRCLLPALTHTTHTHTEHAASGHPATQPGRSRRLPVSGAPIGGGAAPRDPPGGWDQWEERMEVI